MFDIKQVIMGVGLAAAAALGANGAMAQAIYTVNSGGLESFNVSIDGTTYQDALAGGIALNYVSGTGSSVVGVCTDISGTLYLGYNYSFGAPTSMAGQSGLDPSWGALTGNQSANAAAAVLAASDIFHNESSVLTSGSVDQRAGLQLAIWAALYNTVAGVNSISLDGSRFSVGLPGTSTTWSGSWGQTYVGDGAAIQDALNDLAGVNFNANYVGDILIPNPASQYGSTGQEILTNVTPVPEASTIIAGSLLLLPIAASAIRARDRRMVLVRRSA
jgi:hypothetical protein